MTPLLRPLAWRPHSFSFSSRTTRAWGNRLLISRAMLRPTIPPPTTRKSERFIPLLPDLPRRLAAVPQVGEQLLLAIRVHALPVTGMLKRGDLPFLGQPVQRLLLEDATVVGEIFSDALVH